MVLGKRIRLGELYGREVILKGIVKIGDSKNLRTA